MLRLTLAVVLSCSLGAATAAQLVVDPAGVGGAYTSLQAALDAASPGDVIVVHGGVYAAITISKAVTIVGDPRPTIRPPNPSESAFDCSPAVSLAGPGVGAVSLVALDIGGIGSADWFSVFHAGIEGGGFTVLQVDDCAVKGPKLLFATGVGAGGAGIKTTIPLVFVSASTVTGSENTSDSGCFAMPPGPHGIDAPGSTVVVLDSVVEGGAGSDRLACFDGVICGTIAPTQPCPCWSFGGAGGDGIRAQRAYVTNSFVVGGMGMQVMDGCNATATYWGQQPDGAAFHAATVVTAMRSTLTLTGTMKIGTTPVITWRAGSGQLLLLSTSLGVQLDAASGPLFTDPTAPLYIDVIPAGVTSAGTPIPALAALIGTPVVAQVFDPATGLTRPVVDVIRP